LGHVLPLSQRGGKGPHPNPLPLGEGLTSSPSSGEGPASPFSSGEGPASPPSSGEGPASPFSSGEGPASSPSSGEGPASPPSRREGDRGRAAQEERPSRNRLRAPRPESCIYVNWYISSETGSMKSNPFYRSSCRICTSGTSNAGLRRGRE